MTKVKLMIFACLTLLLLCNQWQSDTLEIWLAEAMAFKTNTICQDMQGQFEKTYCY